MIDLIYEWLADIRQIWAHESSRDEFENGKECICLDIYELEKLCKYVIDNL